MCLSSVLPAAGALAAEGQLGLHSVSHSLLGLGQETVAVQEHALGSP